MHKGKAHLIITWVASPDQVPEVDRLVESHGSWMASSHPRDGANALLSYDLSKGPELANALDPGAESTGNTRYVLSEVYESPEGIATTGACRPSRGATSARWWRSSAAATRRRCTVAPSRNPSGRRPPVPSHSTRTLSSTQTRRHSCS